MMSCRFVTRSYMPAGVWSRSDWSGTSGNISVRCGDKVLILLPGSYDTLSSDGIVSMDFDGGWQGNLRPHRNGGFTSISCKPPDVNAVVRTSLYATSLAICRRDIPAVHYMIATAGGTTITVPSTLLSVLQALSVNDAEGHAGKKLLPARQSWNDIPGQTWRANPARVRTRRTLAHQYVISLTIRNPVSSLCTG